MTNGSDTYLRQSKGMFIFGDLDLNFKVTMKKPYRLLFFVYIAFWVTACFYHLLTFSKLTLKRKKLSGIKLSVVAQVIGRVLDWRLKGC